MRQHRPSKCLTNFARSDRKASAKSRFLPCQVRLSALRIEEGNFDSTDFREILHLGFLLQLADTLPFLLKSIDSSSHDT
jgi:hypothetical protein